MGDTQLFGNFGDRCVAAPKRKRASARGDLKAVYPRQYIQDFLGNPFREILRVLVWTQIIECEDSN